MSTEVQNSGRYTRLKPRIFRSALRHYAKTKQYSRAHHKSCFYSIYRIHTKLDKYIIYIFWKWKFLEFFFPSKMINPQCCVPLIVLSLSKSAWFQNSKIHLVSSTCKKWEYLAAIFKIVWWVQDFIYKRNCFTYGQLLQVVIYLRRLTRLHDNTTGKYSMLCF